ncbi:hypothetical protein THRCLA_00763 [Thraustotheca clavata]|uniref:Uncharacterized protein n=1 Tax=Thraustotheca clavata TaxID=74557 RepID=A0A1W0AAN0_9STRA|nr:hypothetical protein THRCLA_00763 [Thraustotheca clavata]
MIRVEPESVEGPATNLLQYPTKSTRVNRLQTRHEGGAAKAGHSSRLLDFFFGPVQTQKPKLKSNVGPRVNAMDTLNNRSLSPNSRSRRGNKHVGVTQSLDRRGLSRQQTFAGHEGTRREPMADDRRRENNSAPITQNAAPYQPPTSVFATQPRNLKKAHTMEVSQFGKIKQAAAAVPQDNTEAPKVYKKASAGDAPKIYKKAGSVNMESPPRTTPRSNNQVESSPHESWDAAASRPRNKPRPTSARSDSRPPVSHDHEEEQKASMPRRKSTEGSESSFSTTTSSQSSARSHNNLPAPQYHHVSSQNTSWMDGIVDDDLTLDCLTPVSCILAQSYESHRSSLDDLSSESSLDDLSPRSSYGRETDDYEAILRKYQQEAKNPAPTTKNVLVEFEF